MECFMKIVGCIDILSREELEDHMKDETLSHTQLTATHLESLRKEK